MPGSVPPPMSSLAFSGATVAGKYRLDTLVGFGGMGSVWAATHLGLGHQLAIKLISKTHASTPEIRRRFDTEAKAVARLKSRHVVQVFDNGELEDGTPFIAMELLTGESVHRRIQTKGPVQLPEGVAIVSQACRALSKAHAAGIIHRDIKPDNLFLAQSDDDDTILVKVLDFGVAKIALTENDKTSSTQTGSLVGTPLYMSPEQARGLKGIDHRTDLYSLALVTFTMLTGTLAFHGESFGDLLLNICTQPLPALRRGAPWLPIPLDAWFQRAAAREPKDRFQSAQEFAEAFAIASGESPSRPTLSGFADQSGPFRVVLPPNSTRDVLADSSSRPFDRRQVGLGSANTITGATMQAPPAALPTALTTASSGRSRKRGGRNASIALGVVFLGTLGVWAVRHQTAPAAAARPAPAAAASPSSRAPLPPDVEAVFAQGDKEEREGRRDLAQVTFTKGSDADPASPELGLVASLYFRGDPRAGRTYFHRAWEARGTLSPRDAAILAAYEPVFQREPADFAESTARLDVAMKTFPGDAEMHYLAGSNLGTIDGEEARALEELKKSIALDPHEPHVLDIAADSQAYVGDFSAAEQAIDDCLRIAPDGLECLGEQIWLDSEQGACDKVEAAARRMLAIDPDYSIGIDALANALYAQGRSLDSAQEILRRRANAGGLEAHEDAAHVAILSGNFAAAEDDGRALEKVVAGSNVLAERAAPAGLLVEIAIETGRLKEADAVARDYLKAYEAWEANAALDDWAMAQEPTPLMLAVRARQGTLPRSAYDAQLARLVTDWGKRSTSALRNFIWIDAYAAPAQTADEANAALAALPRYQPLPPFKPLSLGDEAVGRTFALAGKNDLASAPLERATKNCFPVDHPFESTRAYYYLGGVREAAGDTAGACTAYRVVRDRWGQAKPKSLTAEKAAARIAALHCPT